nr:hypothetical protein [Tanacetum cinerariifolium]
MDEGDDGDDDDSDSSGDDADDEDEDEEEEEEHLAPADSAIVIPTDELVSPPEGTKPVMPPPSTDTTTTGSRIIRSCLRHHLQSPTLLPTPILNRGEYFREPKMRYQMKVLHYIPWPEEPKTPPTSQDEDEHEPMFIQPHDPDFVPKPIYLEYMPLKDEHVLLAEEQLLPPVVSPNVELPEYVAESDQEEDPEEYEDDETEDGPVDYPTDGGDDDDGDSSKDDADDEDEVEQDKEDEEEEEHLASTDSAVIVPTDELVSPTEGTKPVIPPPSTNTTTTGAKIIVQLQAAISFPPEAEVERLLAMPNPLPSLLASLSPPSAGEHLARCTAPAALPSPPLPPPLHMPPPVDRRGDILETKMPPRKRLCLSTLGSRYGTRNTWVDPIETVPEIAPMTVREVNTRVTELAELYEHDTQDLYTLLEDAQDSTDGIDSPSIGRHETRDGRHAGRVASTAQIMAHLTRQGPSTLPNDTNRNNMSPESVQAMIDQALLRNSTNRDGSHSSYEDNRRNVQTVRPCFYPDFMKCQTLNLKGTEGVVGLTRWIEKMESVFQISGCAVENQVKFATYTLSVKASKPKTLDETIELANDLMDHKLRTYVERHYSRTPAAYVDSAKPLSRPPHVPLPLSQLAQPSNPIGRSSLHMDSHLAPFIMDFSLIRALRKHKGAILSVHVEAIKKGFSQLMAKIKSAR